ncbi:NUDIX domain-containing protein [Chitinophaga sancti]|uniref:NUDIX domain-containing protein n=2 Tax=Chitinophaga sancti TaxID=1004 RepID=A0A1K1RX81_9BACT|nr:NUDIX domain-containing protein [Chitinophaga sancti]
MNGYFCGMKRIHTAGLVVVKDRKLLLGFSKNKGAWYLPGGKIDAGETALQAVRREVEEELNISIPEEELKWYYHITAPAFGEVDLMMEQDCFLHELKQEIVPSAEIGALKYFDSEMYGKEEHQVPGVLIAFERLKETGLI